MLALVAVTGAAVLFGTSRRALASSTILDVADGDVYVRHAGAEALAQDDEPLFEGDTVRTGADGHAVILFFDGSTLSLEPGAQVRLDAARIADRATVIDLYQAAGTTWHAVHKLLDPGSRYQVTTPSMTAAVRGTAFEVRVGEAEDNVTTEEGVVEVSARRQSVRVGAGQQSVVPRGAAPHPPQPAPRPQRVLRLDLVGGAGTLVDGSRRSVGVAPDGSLRNAIPGAHVERDGDVVHVSVPNPSRDLRFAPGPELRSVSYTVVDASGRSLATGEGTATAGTLPGIPNVIRDALPEATPKPEGARPANVMPRLSGSPRPIPVRTPTLTPPSHTPIAVPPSATAGPRLTLPPLSSGAASPVAGGSVDSPPTPAPLPKAEATPRPLPSPTLPPLPSLPRLP